MKTKLLTLFVALFVATNLFAYDFQHEDLFYNFTGSNTVEVTYQYKNYLGDNYGDIKYVTIPSVIEYNGETYSVTSIGSYAFSRSGVKTIDIPSTIETIGDHAFYYCNSLNSVTITEGLQTIENNAFLDCTLTSISIPNTVIKIGKGAFKWCDYLSTIILSENLTALADELFYECKKLKEITIPEKVNKIGTQTFYSCSSLEDVIIPISVSEIGAEAFFNCYSLQTINIPQNVTTIGRQAFYRTWNVHSIAVDSKNSIFDSRENCNAIIETMTNKLICGSMSTTIPSSVEIIEDNAFGECFNLMSLIIPQNIKKIGHEAFTYCSLLRSVTCMTKEVPESGNGIFSAVPINNLTLYVPAESIDLYRNSEPWKNFGTILPIDNTTTAIENAHSSSFITNTHKLIRDGQLFILRDGVEYNALGQIINK